MRLRRLPLLELPFELVGARLLCGREGDHRAEAVGGDGGGGGGAGAGGGGGTGRSVEVVVEAGCWVRQDGLADRRKRRCSGEQAAATTTDEDEDEDEDEEQEGNRK
ncbi:unnamed protein product [Soboliphyme baturini]|uniref:Uncharacterized protein n=1 Tax=Soboliphyme baturini TaxID=241478 RepID=A0A183IME3_9BILA|nr:unnamed protein product [Soboliphyme baturini]